MNRLFFIFLIILPLLFICPNTFCSNYNFKHEPITQSLSLVLKDSALTTNIDTTIRLSRELTINHLPGNINTYGSELNFTQVNKNTAYYTSSSLEENIYQSSIFSSTLKQGKWQKGKYINLGNSFSSANSHFPNNELGFYFNPCDTQGNCKIAFRNYKKQITEELGSNINLLNSTNTQPHIAIHNEQKVMYFVSDRKGGFGGMDIWLSIISKGGNYGVPINAGDKINSAFDEITPFFNSFEEVLYFSSNRTNGLGGFDIYTSKGKLNLWDQPINAIQFNTKQDEMYLSFYKETKGYFSSNRKGALFASNEFCCNDIFCFELDERDIKPQDNIFYITKLLPLKLYFHNDEPDCCTMSVTTDKTYKDAYISYFKMEEKYNLYSPNLSIFFEDSLKGNFNKLNRIFSYVLADLKLGKRIQLHVKGFTSPLHKKDYNINLSKRRIKSFVNYLSLYENMSFLPFLKSGFLKIIELPFGESNSTKKVSDNAEDSLNSIYSLDAILERRIEIIDVKLVE